MIPRAFDDVGPDDLDALVRDQVAESRTIEYKAALFENNDSGKKEFLADVSSFANAPGGDLIYGIAAADGVPREVWGLPECNGERDLLRLDSIIRDGVAPRMPGVRLKWIQDHPAGPVLLLRIPRIWMGPHMVTFKDSSRFYSRSPAGKFQMDVAEIRAAFEGAAEIPARIQRWRDERLGRLVADAGPFRIGEQPCFVLHIVPVESFVDEGRLGVPLLEAQARGLSPIGAGGWDWQINVDGFVCFVPQTGGVTSAYTQVFRSGRIEAVTSRDITDREGARLIASVSYEQNLKQATAEYLRVLHQLDVEPPFFIMLSLLNAKGAVMALEARWSSESATPIDRDVLMFPEVLVEATDTDVVDVLRPVFDSVWNACGLPRSQNYEEDGRWKWG
ncbi:MAG: ATP-binding protein [Phycisphaeraceae bacterium]